MVKPQTLIATRPTESGAAAAAAAVLLARALGVDDALITDALIIMLGALPGAITWLVVLIRGR
jgi:hypothetical protein